MERIANGTLSATGSTAAIAVGGPNYSGGRRKDRSMLLVMSGDGVGTIYPERSPDGTNWFAVPADAQGTPAAIPVSGSAISLDVREAVSGVVWRLRFVRTSGTVNWEIWE